MAQKITQCTDSTKVKVEMREEQIWCLESLKRI